MENNKKTFIFIGRSGCGKGTQAKLLAEWLKESGQITEDSPLLYMETGDRFREFISGTSHSSRLAKTIMEQGDRQPDFLAVWMWSHLLVENIMGDEHIIFDGTPRSLLEAKALDTAMTFYDRKEIYVIHLSVSRQISEERMISRKRADDNVEDIKKRLDWFDKDVAPVLDYYRDNPNYKYLEINGEQTIEKIKDDIQQAL